MIRLYRGSKGPDYSWESLFTAYKQHVSKTSRVLEIGASSSDKTQQLSELCQELIGVELFPGRTQKNAKNIKNVTGDWQHLSEFIDESSIDVVVISHVLEHVPDDLKAINELYKVVKPGGVALLNTPNRKRLTRSIVEIFSKEREFPHWEHQREYIENDLRVLLDKSHFTNYEIMPVVFGVHGGPIFFYSETVPARFRRLANYWEVHLFR